MNHEFKYMLIENENEYASKILDEIKNASDESELLRLLDKIISVQYYKGIYTDPDEYDEIISAKINEIYDVEIENSYSENEIKYFLESLLESYDLFLSKLDYSVEITDSIKIISEYLINILDSEIFLDEINSDYLDEIIAYESDESLEYYINDILSCYNIDSNNELISKYFNYDAYISDMLESNELIKIDYNNSSAYVINYNIL